MSLSRDPEEAISHGAYRAMVEQRNEARAERDRYRETLEWVALLEDVETADVLVNMAGRLAREALDG